MKTVRFPLVNWKSMFVVFAESSLALQNDTTMKMQNVLILSTSKLWVCNWSINKNLLNNTASFISTWSWRLFLFSDAIAQPAPKRCRPERVWDFPNKHFATQNRHLYVQMHCLQKLWTITFLLLEFSISSCNCVETISIWLSTDILIL